MAIADSPEAICTMAMDILKSISVGDLSNPSTNAEKLCRRWYDECRQAMIGMADLSFSRSRAVVSLDLTAALAFGSEGSYLLPQDYMGLRFIDSEDYPLDSTQYDIVENRHLLLDRSDATVNIGYIKDVEDVYRYPALFRRALAADIAMCTAMQITGKSEFVAAAKAVRDEALAAAQNQDMRSRPNKVVTTSALAGARAARSGELGTIATGRVRLR